MHVDVRRVRPQETDELKAVRLAALLDAPSAFGSTYAREVVLSDDDWRRRADGSSTGDAQTTFLAWHDGHGVGIVGAHRSAEAPTTVELVSMWTAPQARRSGVARLLVGAVVDWSFADGSTESVSLWVTRGNVAAQTLYESMGFRTVDEHRPAPSDPCRSEIRMRLTPNS